MEPRHDSFQQKGVSLLNFRVGGCLLTFTNENITKTSKCHPLIEDGGEWQKALELFYQLSDAQLQPNVISYDAILDSTQDPEVARVMFLGFPKICDQNRCFSRGCSVCV